MATAKAAAPAPAKAAAPPPPAQQQGTHGPRSALAPSLVEMPKDAPDPVKETSARQKAAIEKFQAQRDKNEVEKAEVGDEKPAPKAKGPGTSSDSSETKKPTESTASKSESSAKDEKPASKDDESKKPEPATDSGDAAEREPRITLKSYRKWAEKNPEIAAEIGQHHYKLNSDQSGEYIRIQNKRRKMNLEAAEERKAHEAKMTEREAAVKKLEENVNGAAKALVPIADLWDAARSSAAKKQDGSLDLSKVDFDAADAAFQANAGVSIDDYMRARARRGIVSPELAKARAENARLQRELAAKSEKPAEAKTEELEKPKAEPAKAKPEPERPDWGGEIPTKHGLRKIANWEALLDAEMRRFHDADLDEYSEDPEAAADRVLKRELAALSGEDDEEEAPKKTTKPKPKIRAKAPEKAKAEPDDPPQNPRRLKPVAQLPDDDADAPKDFAKRERWAMERFQRRLRGEHVE